MAATARLLLVDDETVLLELLKKYLERLGYEVDACAHPEEALLRFAEDPLRYSLVLTDLTLPGLSGEEMVSRMREKTPQLRVIIASGYPHAVRGKWTSFLQKPFLPKMLAEAIEKILAV